MLLFLKRDAMSVQELPNRGQHLVRHLRAPCGAELSKTIEPTECIMLEPATLRFNRVAAAGAGHRQLLVESPRTAAPRKGATVAGNRMATTVDKGHWTREQIAALDDRQLARLNYDELVEIVLASGVQVRDRQRVCTMESDALVRLAHVARRHCCSRYRFERATNPPVSLVIATCKCGEESRKMREPPGPEDCSIRVDQMPVNE
jgi:hypothetical protein